MNTRNYGGFILFDDAKLLTLQCIVKREYQYNDALGYSMIKLSGQLHYRLSEAYILICIDIAIEHHMRYPSNAYSKQHVVKRGLDL